MSDSIERLFEEWQRTPDAATSLALCNALRGVDRDDLMNEVGNFVLQRHTQSAPALIAAGRMYLEAGRIDDAQAAFVAAGRVAPRDAVVYRWLGEVLLRRGDADRAEKVLERAVAFGGRDEETTFLHERARALGPLFRTVGPEGVAAQFDAAFTVRFGPRVRIRARQLSLSDVDTEIKSRKEVDDAITLARTALPGAQFSHDESLETLARAASRDPSFSLAGAGLDRDYTPSSAKVRSAAPTAEARSIKPTSRPPPPLPRSRPPPPLPTAAPVPSGPFDPPSIVVTEPEKPLSPDALLRSLETSGLFEPNAKEDYAWTPAPKPRQRGRVIAASVISVLFAGAAAGGFAYLRDQRHKAHGVAEQTLATVDAKLAAAEPQAMADVERDLRRAIAAEPASVHAAQSWMRARVLKGLLLGTSDASLESGIRRARELGMPAKDTAFALTASYLFSEDLAGALDAVAQWDASAGQDAYFQLVAGAVLERAGDARAQERYAAAMRLSPELMTAETGLLRCLAQDGDPKKAMELARNLRQRAPERTEGVALLAFAWAKDPARGEAPKEAEAAEQLGALPAALRAIPHGLFAARALDARDGLAARAALKKGLAVAESAQMATWIGMLALDAGDDALGSEASQRALSLSPVYTPGRLLAARVALQDGRLADAELAVATLTDGTILDATITRVALGYERMDPAATAKSAAALPEGARNAPLFLGVVLSNEVLTGKVLGPERALQLRLITGPWTDLVRMDSLLDSGELDAATELARQWTQEPARPLRKLRLARLARYQGRLVDAAALLGELEAAQISTERVVAERALLSLQQGKPDEVIARLSERPQRAGPAGRFLLALALVRSGREAEARSKLAQEPLPTATSSLLHRSAAASALLAIKDKRAGDLARALSQSGMANTDVSRATEAAGLGKTRKKP
jgi:Tfp pilus assembly protein PilF